jgi:hypothetical protein
MAYRTWVVGEIVTAANVQAFLQNQAVISCTSGTRPVAPAEPWMVAETDTDSLNVYDGAAWRRLPGTGWSANARTLTIRRAAAQVVAASTTFDISWDTEDRDSEGWFTAPSTGLTVPAGGGGLVVVTVTVVPSVGSINVTSMKLTTATNIDVYPSQRSGDGLRLGALCSFAAADTLKVQAVSAAPGLTFTATMNLQRVSW